MLDDDDAGIDFLAILAPEIPKIFDRPKLV